MNLTPRLHALMLAALLTSASASTLAANQAAPLGNPVPVSGSQQTIELQPGTRYLNIEQGQTLKFVAKGKAFAWNFDTFGLPVFNLSDIAPKDVDVGNVRVYISPDRTYAGGAN